MEYNQNEKLVSVVIPFYKGASWLKEAINSVYNGSYQNFEIIVVDDGSTEDIRELISSYDVRLVYFKQSNKGPAIARNKGIDAANGEYIAFLDSDDYWAENKLKLQVELMDSTKAAWSHTGYTVFMDGTEEHESIDVESIKGNIYPWCLYSCKIATPCVMVRKEVLEKNSLKFEEDMRNGQDAILWFRLASMYQIELVNKVCTHVRKVGSNVSQDVIKQFLTRQQLWQKICEFEEDKLKAVKGIGKLSYQWCGLLGKCVRKIQKKIPRTVLKIISIVLYSPAYLGFKISAMKGKNKVSYNG